MSNLLQENGSKDMTGEKNMGTCCSPVFPEQEPWRGYYPENPISAVDSGLTLYLDIGFLIIHMLLI